MVSQKDYQQDKNQRNDEGFDWGDSYGDIWKDFDEVISIDGEDIDIKKLIDELKKER